MMFGVQVGSKHRSTIDQKRESRWEGILASIFNGFCLILGGKLGRKIEPRQDKTGQDRARQDKTKTKTRQDKTLADKELERTF